MLVTMKEMLNKAHKSDYAVPAFSIYGAEVIQGIVEEANARQSPVILMVSTVYLDYLGLEQVALMGKTAAGKVDIPVALHLDHGDSVERCKACLEAGFSSVMIDASSSSLNKNIAVTTKVVKLAQQYGASVEAELGTVGGVEDAVFEAHENSSLTLINPQDAIRFVNETKLDCLAPAIGTVHGLTKKEPRLDIPLLARVHDSVDIPLVLHGGSGLSDATIKDIIKAGARKINVGTELKLAWSRGLAAYFAENGSEPRLALDRAKEEVRKVVGRKIELFGSSGKA